MGTASNEGGEDYHPEEQSLLEDASTLLMFSQSNSQAGGSNKTQSQDRQQIKHERSSLSSSSLSSVKPNKASTNTRSIPSAIENIEATLAINAKSISTLTSPGPADAMLMEDAQLSSGDNSSKTRSGSGSSISSQKGRVAAAALAAAAVVPLPLKRTYEGKDATHGKKLKQEEQQKLERGGNEESGDRLSSREGSVDGQQQDSDAYANVKREAKDEWPVPDSYIVDPDDGIITCVCGFDDDDGFTIQCDHCYRWQHATCYGIEDENAAPDDFLCKVCHPRNIDVKAAKRKQQERIRGNKRRKRSTQSEDRTPSRDQSSVGSASNRVDPNESIGLQVTNTPSVAAAETAVKQHFMNAKEAFPAVYLPLTTYDYKDKYVGLFVSTHSDDDWVIPYTLKTFKPLPLDIQPYSDSTHQRTFPGFSKLGVFIQQSCSRGTLIDEFLGEVDFQKNYLSDPRNNYQLLGTPSSKVIFHPHWPIYIDARLSGNITRCVRHSCNPNVELVTIRLEPTASASSNSQQGQYNNVKFVLRALRDIEKDEELHIRWDWDLRHPIWRLINGSSIDSLEEANRYLLIHSVDTVSSLCDCACGNSKDCNLLKVKKYAQSLYKSIKSKMNNRYKLNEILQRGKVQHRRQTSILSSLAHEAISNSARAHEVLVNFNNSKLAYLEAKDKLPSKPMDPSVPSTEPAGKYASSIHGLNIDSQVSSLSKDLKPYKYRLLERYREVNTKLSSKDKKSVIINPFEFDESGVRNLKALAIPVEVQIPIKQAITVPVNNTRPSSAQAENTVASSSVRNVPDQAMTRPIAHAATSLTTAASIGAMAAATVTGSTTGVLGSGGLAATAANPQNTKKKLSFADYKRKVKPA